MSGSGAFGFSNQSSSASSSQESGVSGPDRAFATEQAFRVLSSLEPIISQFMGNAPQLQLTNGLTPGASSLAGSLVTDQTNRLFSKLSGTGALRGQVNPANTSNIIGTATERAVASALPQFVNQARENEFFNATSQQNTQSQGIQFLQQIASLFSGLTQGSSGESSGSSKGFSISGSAGGGAGGGGSVS